MEKKMAKCEIIETCIFFNEKMSSMPTAAEMMKKNYCLGDNTKCARYMVFKALGREKVPVDLFPNQVERAESIINNK